jgi:hypothetical protein
VLGGIPAIVIELGSFLSLSREVALRAGVVSRKKCTGGEKSENVLEIP